MSQIKDVATIRVITPCLKASDLLQLTIKGVLEQEGNFHLHYHVQDGSRSNEVAELLKRWEKNVKSGAVAPRCRSLVFTWASSSCNSLYEAIVEGIARLDISPNDFVTWLNPGDILLPGALERVARVAVARPDVLWVSGPTHIVDAKGATLIYEPLNQFPQDIIAAGLCDKLHWDAIPQAGSFWRHKLYVEVGGFDLSFINAGDWDLWRRFAQVAPRYVLPVSLVASRWPPDYAVPKPEVWLQEIDSALPMAARRKASLELLIPRGSFLPPRLPDPLLAPTLEGDDAERAEAWRRRVCPDKPWPRITIVTPSFNQGIFLEACIRSVLDQNYPNLEYIVMDGGSTDNSLSIIRKYSSQLAYWQSKPDGGPGYAFTEGLNRGTGEIMACLCADDIYLGPCLFKVAMQFMANPDTMWITGRPAVCEPLGRITFHRDLLWSRAGLLNVSCSLKDQFLALNEIFWRRDLWIEAGSHFKTELPYADDFELWVRFSRIAPIRIVQDIFSAFRHHGDQRSLNQKKEYIRQMCDVVERELKQLSPKQLPADFFTAHPPQSMAYVDALAPLTGMPLPDAPAIENPGQDVHSLEDLKQGLAQTRESINTITSYHEAIHLDDLALHVQLSNNMHGIRCVSFDCFDTILYRLCKEPTQLFVEVGRRLQKAGNLKPNLTPEQFKQLRIAAENKARQIAMETRGTTECCIEEIYIQLQTVVPNIIQGVRTELQTEQDFCYPNPVMLGLMRYYREQGYKIAILSDTYLSSKQLSSILEHSGVDLSLVDLVLTSRDAQAAKYEGKLYFIAADKLGIRPQEILHIGDSELADVKAAQAMGVRGIHYPRYPGATLQVLQRERILQNLDRQAASLTSFRLLAYRLGGQLHPIWRGYYQEGAFLFGPALARYADWVVQQCKQEGVTMCLAFMREAQTLVPLIKRSAEASGYKLEVRPFYISRHSVNLASMFEVSAKSLFEKTIKHRKCSPRTLLKALGLPEDKLTGLDPSLMDSPLNDLERFTFCEILAKHPFYSALLAKHAQKARHAFLSYALTNLDGHQRLAIADIGFRGTIQLNMERILRNEGINVPIIGLYFCTQAAAANSVLEGLDIRSFLGHLGAYQQETQTLYKHPEILEQAVNAFCGTTLGYSKGDSGAYQPEIEDVSIPFDQLYKRWLIQQGILSFQRIWLAFAGPRFLNGKGTKKLDSKCLEEIDTEILYIMQRLFCFPTRDEALRLGSLYHDDNDGTDLGGIICDNDARMRFRQGGLEKLVSEMVYWPHGVVAIEAPEIFEQMFAIKSRFELL